MVSYKCEKCNKEFKQKINYTNHVNRKNPCNKKYKCEKCNKEFNQKNHYISHINRKIPCNLEKLYKCNVCGKEFSHKSSCSRHQKKCNNYPKLDIKNIKSTVNNNSINNVNYINANNYNNIINNNIFILPYNEKDKISLSDSMYKSILNSGYKCIPKLIEQCHFNKNHPAYHNIYIPNIKEKYVLIYTGNEWEIRNSDKILDDIINYKIDELEDKFDEIILDLPDKVISKFRKFLEKKESDNTINLIKEDLKILLYNKRHIPQNTRNILKDCSNNEVENINNKDIKKIEELLKKVNNKDFNKIYSKIEELINLT